MDTTYTNYYLERPLLRMRDKPLQQVAVYKRIYDSDESQVPLCTRAGVGALLLLVQVANILELAFKIIFVLPLTLPLIFPEFVFRICLGASVETTSITKEIKNIFVLQTARSITRSVAGTLLNTPGFFFSNLCKSEEQIISRDLFLKLSKTNAIQKLITLYQEDKTPFADPEDGKITTKVGDGDPQEYVLNYDGPESNKDLLQIAHQKFMEIQKN